MGIDTAHAGVFVLVIRVSSRWATPAATVRVALFWPGVMVKIFTPSQMMSCVVVALRFPNWASAVLFD